MIRFTGTFVSRSIKNTWTMALPRVVSFSSMATTVQTSVEGGENLNLEQLYPNGVYNKIACIGTGMISQAFIEPLISGNVQPPERFTIFDVNVATMKQVVQTYEGINVAESIHECVKGADLVICAVKPQNLTESFFSEMKKGASEDSILLSVIAGKSLNTFYEAGYTKIVRSMPNTPATIGQGMTVWSATDNLTVEDREKIRIVLNSCGKSVCIFSCKTQVH
jgi:pyrroline-5-carboxylate reductase